MQSKFEHSCIRVLDPEKSLEFYRQALGLELEEKRDFPDKGFTLYYLTDRQTGFLLELTYNYDRSEPYQLGEGYSHIAVTVNDLEAAHELHKKMGLNPTELKGLPGGRNYYFIADPDGYRIEVIRGE